MLSACGMTPPPTAEEQAQVNELRQAFIQRLSQASQPPLQQQPQQPIVQQTLMSEEELLQAVTAARTSGSAATFERNRDGVLINNAMYLDPEGTIVNVGSETLSGNFNYIVRNFDGSFSLKSFRANSAASPVLVATIYQSGADYTVKTVTGKTMTGSDVIPTADGIIVARSGSAFRYTMGANIKAISVLNGYHVASIQKGDVSSTGFILLEKSAEQNSSDLAKLTANLSSIGNIFGQNKSQDYLLANIQTGALIPLDVRVDGKDVAIYSNCRRQNSVVNKCDNMDMRETLYHPKTGLRNGNHYFWAVDWVNTENGPIAFYKTSTKLYAVDVNKGQLHELFSRTLGVNHFDVTQGLTGKVSVTAKLGFSSDTIDDVLSFMQSNSPEKIEQLEQVKI